MHLDSETQQCVDNCLRCQSICLSTAMNYCLEGDPIKSSMPRR
ncbi:hypothetical protein [Rhizobium leguminosarum]|nr:hypothetical protein [Rhizobium leguminosarum]